MSSRERLCASIAELRRARNLTVYQASFKPGESIRMNLTEIRMILTEQLVELSELAKQIETDEEMLPCFFQSQIKTG